MDIRLRAAMLRDLSDVVSLNDLEVRLWAMAEALADQVSTLAGGIAEGLGMLEPSSSEHHEFDEFGNLTFGRRVGADGGTCGCVTFQAVRDVRRQSVVVHVTQISPLPAGAALGNLLVRSIGLPLSEPAQALAAQMRRLLLRGRWSADDLLAVVAENMWATADVKAVTLDGVRVADVVEAVRTLTGRLNAR